ncbi:unnamed protein product [Cunninghamella blakesleeana]
MTDFYSNYEQAKNASTNSLPRTTIANISSDCRSSFSGLEVPTTMNDIGGRKGLTLQRSQPSLSTSFKSSSKKKTKSIEFHSDIVLDTTSTLSTTDTSTKTTRFASEKRNKEFHHLFKSIPEEERLIEDYGCALQKEILLQGRIYISQRYVCFNANIFGWVTNLVIAFSDIIEIEKKTTAIIIPNAIQISTHQAKHFFASFLSREQAYEHMMDIWKSPTIQSSLNKDSNDSYDDDQSNFSDDDDSLSFTEWDEKDQLKKKPYQHDILSSSNEQWHHDERQSSLASLPIPKQKNNDESEAARRRAVSEAGPRPSTESLTLMQNASEVPLPNHDHLHKINSHQSDKTIMNHQYDLKNESNGLPTSSSPPLKPSSSTTTTITNATPSSGMNVSQQGQGQSSTTTECECTNKSDDHYSNVVMDQTYPCSMETLYNLLFQSDFVKKFLTDIERNTDVVIGAWQKGGDEKSVYSRDVSYIKYLGGSIGPKTTKCILKEELTHVDLKNSITQQITCHTPDVPSGNSFCVKTRVCLSWSGQGCVRMLVTVQVPFTKSSWLKSTIEKASIFGQVNYYKKLDTTIRQYTESKSSKSSHHNSNKKHRNKRKQQSRLSTHANGKDTNPNNNDSSLTHKKNNNNGILGTLSDLSSDLIQMMSDFGTKSISVAQCTMVCLVLMVMINLYIALKMAYMGDQIYTLQSHSSSEHSSSPLSSSSSSSSFLSHFYQHQDKKASSSLPLDNWRNEHQKDVDSMWHWLNQLEKPNQQKEQKQAFIKKSNTMNHNSNYILTDHFKHQGRVSSKDLNQHIMELEKMVYRTEYNIDQVTKAVKQQRRHLLQNLAS